MEELVSWTIGGIVVVTIVAFIAYLIGLRAIPLAERPKTPTYNRFGQLIGEAENPDFHVNPGENPSVELEAELERLERKGSA